MQLFSFFYYVTFIQFKICWCVQNFIEIGWVFAEIWRYNDFQNGCRPPSWNCFTTIRDHPRSLLLAAAACQISCQSDTHNLNSEDMAIIFRIFGLKCLFRPPKLGFRGTFGPLNVIIYSPSRPPKGTSLRKSASFRARLTNGDQAAVQLMRLNLICSLIHRSN